MSREPRVFRKSNERNKFVESSADFQLKTTFYLGADAAQAKAFSCADVFELEFFGIRSPSVARESFVYLFLPEFFPFQTKK